MHLQPNPTLVMASLMQLLILFLLVQKLDMGGADDELEDDAADAFDRDGG